MSRLTIGRLQVYLEPRDLWIGVYIARDAVYVCPLPLLVFRWTRRRWLIDRAVDEMVGGIKTESSQPKPFDLSALPVLTSKAVPDGQIYVINQRLLDEAFRFGQPIPPQAAVRLDVEGDPR